MSATMTEEQAQRQGRLRVVAIMELLLLADRQAEIRQWAQSELTVEQVQQRLVDDKLRVTPQSSWPGASPVMSGVEASFAARGLAIGRH